MRAEPYDISYNQRFKDTTSRIATLKGSNVFMQLSIVHSHASHNANAYIYMDMYRIVFGTVCSPFLTCIYTMPNNYACKIIIL